MSKWISVKDRLPEKPFSFVIVYADGAMSTLGYGENGFFEPYPVRTQVVIEDITHWMPLPEPPKAGGE